MATSNLLIFISYYSWVNDGEYEGDEIRHAWYQWVGILLAFQAILFYVPHYLWKSWEGTWKSILNDIAGQAKEAKLSKEQLRLL